MPTRRVCAIAVFGLLAVSSPAYAGWLDFIWELSGPQMFGIGGKCEFSVTRNASPQCLVGPFRFPWNELGILALKDDPIWFDVEAHYYFSTGRNPRDAGQESEFTRGSVQMIGVDPMMAFGKKFTRQRVHGGVGFSFNRFYGGQSESFGTYAIKVRPIGYERRLSERLIFTVSYNIRRYPRGFEASGNPPVLLKGRVGETAHGIIAEISF